MATTRTSSPYFSPNRARAPDAMASSTAISRVVTSAFCSTMSFAMSSTCSISSRAHRLGVREVEPQPVRRDQRALLGDVIAQHLAQRLVQQMGRRMVGADRAAARMVDFEGQRKARLERAFLDHAGMDEEVAALLLGIGDAEAHAVGGHHAGVADLAARFAVERRLVEDDGAGLALAERRRPPCRRAPARRRRLPRSRSRSRGTRWRRPSRAGANHTVSVAASPEPAHDARAFSRWRSIAALKASVSTAMPRGLSASWVRSSGKPKVS